MITGAIGLYLSREPSQERPLPSLFLYSEFDYFYLPAAVEAAYTLPTVGQNRARMPGIPEGGLVYAPSTFDAGQGIGRNYARADFDRTLNFIQSYLYELPFGQGKHFLAQGVAGKIIGGWQVSGIFSARTGTPLTFTGSNTLNLGSNGTATLDQIAPISVLGGINTNNPWFSTSSFAKAATNVQGSTGRNIFNGPGLISLNVGLSRWIVIRE